jgi:hypothetical protein
MDRTRTRMSTQRRTWIGDMDAGTGTDGNSDRVDICIVHVHGLLTC